MPYILRSRKQAQHALSAALGSDMVCFTSATRCTKLKTPIKSQQVGNKWGKWLLRGNTLHIQALKENLYSEYSTAKKWLHDFLFGGWYMGA
jgi:hypothetical protein